MEQLMALIILMARKSHIPVALDTVLLETALDCAFRVENGLDQHLFAKVINL